MTQRVWRITENERADGSIYFRLEYSIEGSEWNGVYSSPNIEDVRAVKKEREAKQAASRVVKQTVVE